MNAPGTDLLDRLVARCTFPDTAATVALSGGPDSSALLALAVHAGLRPTAIHVHHGLRPSADQDAATAERIAARFGVPYRLERAHLEDGPNLEARARAARLELFGTRPPEDAGSDRLDRSTVMTGHTADDQAETVLLALIRGSGATGLGGMRPGPRHPILGLRRHETHLVCAELGLEPAVDPTNAESRFRRNRVRAEMLPLLDDVAERDVTPLLARAAELLRDDDDLLDDLAAEIDPTDATAIASAPRPLARRALRRWLQVEGYAPDAAAIERVMAVARREHRACEIAGGRRVARSGGRLRIEGGPPSISRPIATARSR